jgi:hypothetical protein
MAVDLDGPAAEHGIKDRRRHPDIAGKVLSEPQDVQWSRQ